MLQAFVPLPYGGGDPIRHLKEVRRLKPLLVWVVVGLLVLVAVDQLTRLSLKTVVESRLLVGVQQSDTLVVFAHGTQASDANARVLHAAFKAYGDTLAFQELGTASDVPRLVRQMVGQITTLQMERRYQRIILYGESKGGQLLALVGASLKQDALYDNVTMHLIMHGSPYDSTTLLGVGRQLGPLLGMVRTGALVNLLPIVRWATPAEVVDPFAEPLGVDQCRLVREDREHALSLPFSLWTAQVGFASRLWVSEQTLRVFKCVVYIVDKQDAEVVDGRAALEKFRQLRPDITSVDAASKHVNAARQPEANTRVVEAALAAVTR